MVLDWMDEGAQRLVFVLCLPLVDGVFATLLVTGAVETFSAAVNVALTVFTGAGALAILYSSSDSGRHARKMAVQAAPFLILGSMVVALVAPAFEQMFYVHRLKYAAGLALVVIAGHLSRVELAEKFSVPAIILTGLLLSVRDLSAAVFSLEYVAPALLTSGIAAAGLYLASFLGKERMDLSYIRRGGSIVLLVIALSQFGIEMPARLGLAIFAFSVIASMR
ncbi:MAG: DUF5794 domain-containing protein [Candidatus Nanohaloarchaea archaeon]